MSCPAFTVELPVSPSDYFGEFKRLIERKGGALSGDAQQGTLTGPTPVGPMTARYATINESVRVEVTEKPWLVPCSAIESEIRDLVAQLEQNLPQIVEPPEPPDEPLTDSVVTTLPTTYIEGEVDEQHTPASAPSPPRVPRWVLPTLAVGAAAGTAYWLTKRPRRRRRPAT